jgi:PAS domain S-box-containing protein
MKMEPEHNLLARIFERVSDGIVALDNDWCYVYVNDRAAELIGRPAAALMGKHIWTEFPEGVGQPFYHAYQRAAAEQVFTCVEAYYEPWNRWFENRIYPDAQGLTIYFTDVTERKVAEAERLLALQMRQELKLLESLLDQVLAGYWDWHIPAHTHYMSYGWKRMLGYENDQLPTTPETWKEMIFPADLPVVMGNFEAHIQSHGKISYHNEVRYYHKNGSIVWMICSGEVIEWDRTGQPIRMIGCHIDITDRKQAEENLQRSNHDLEQFAHVISHDLQEPLRAVSGFSQLLHQHLQAHAIDEFEQEALASITDGCDRMRHLIQDLLAYSRLDNTATSVATIDSNLVLAEVLQSLRLMIEESQAIVTHDPLPQNLSIDQTQFFQLLQNLIINAIKFRREVPPKIHIAAISMGDRYQFSIQDNGIGIQPQYFQQIFDSFRRLHSRSQFPGTGLGLAICQKIVDRHGGRIWVDSEFGQGSIFYFSLPINSNRVNGLSWVK